MDTQDRRAIEELFAKLDAVERRTGPRDPEAEAFIRSRVTAQPGAPYYMAQTIIVQEQALEQAKRRIDELERAEQQEGGLLSGLFGGRNRAAADQRPARREAVAPQPWGNQRGGFLSGAAQTAVGVAGGLLLGNLLMGTMFGNDAAASQPADTNTDNTDAGADNADADQEFDTASADSDGGGDFGGDFGGGDF